MSGEFPFWGGKPSTYSACTSWQVRGGSGGRVELWSEKMLAAFSKEEAVVLAHALIMMVAVPSVMRRIEVSAAGAKIIE